MSRTNGAQHKNAIIKQAPTRDRTGHPAEEKPRSNANMMKHATSYATFSGMPGNMAVFMSVSLTATPRRAHVQDLCHHSEL